MKKFISLSICFVCIGLILNAQIKSPVSWTYKANKKATNEYEVVITATIKKPWHIYSQNTGKGGPIATYISFNKSPLITLEGETKEVGKLEKTYDTNFKTDVLYYSNMVVFTQLVKVKAGIKTNISGEIEFMVCDDKQCLPPTKKPFDIKL